METTYEVERETTYEVERQTTYEVERETTYEVERFLYNEARLLDERRFQEWLALYAEDVRYWMPVRGNRYPKSSKAIVIMDPDRYVEDDVARENEMAFFDETKKTLSGRVARLETGMAWAEDPPSKTRHLITNVQVEPGDAADEVKAYSNFIVYRNRAEIEQEFYAGSRQDKLRRVNGGWQLTRRKIVLDMNVLLPKNLAIFF
jgi:3-phenylpropionate/cinnamic acid dioxygenase small subunit